MVAAFASASTVSTVVAFVGVGIACSISFAARTYKNIADGYKSERDLAVDKAARMAGELDDLRKQIRELQLKDVSALFDLMKHHDERMQKASQEILAALQRITLPHA